MESGHCIPCRLWLIESLYILLQTASDVCNTAVLGVPHRRQVVVLIHLIPSLYKCFPLRNEIGELTKCTCSDPSTNSDAISAVMLMHHKCRECLDEDS